VGARGQVENAVTALVSNGLFIGLLTLVPFSVGRLALFVKVPPLSTAPLSTRRTLPPRPAACAAVALQVAVRRTLVASALCVHAEHSPTSYVEHTLT
jgi:hypothetical protein